MTATTNPRGRIKAGVITSATFAGNPKKATVTFAAPYPSTSYAIAVTGIDGRSWVIESKTVAGFVINSQANTALTGDVFWQTQFQGETL